MCTLCDSTGLFKMFVCVLTTCHTQYTWDSSICIFYIMEQHSKILLHTVQVLYMCTLCGSTNINTIIDNHCWHATNSLERTRISCWCLYNHKGCTYRAPVRYVTKIWSVVLLNKKIHILLSQVYCVWQVVKTPTIILNNPVESQSVQIESKCKVRNKNLECCSIE